MTKTGTVWQMVAMVTIDLMKTASLCISKQAHTAALQSPRMMLRTAIKSAIEKGVGTFSDSN